MKKLYKDRLLQVVRVLEDLPKEKKFSIGIWNKCGTVACAVGWAASDPWFNRRGLKIIPFTEEDDLLHNSQGLQKKPVYKNLEEWEAIEVFFNLTDDEAGFLFAEYAYRDSRKRNVIKRIKKFVKDGHIALA